MPGAACLVDPKTMPLPSGVQSGALFRPGKCVRRDVVPRSRSFTQISACAGLTANS